MCKVLYAVRSGGNDASVFHTCSRWHRQYAHVMRADSMHSLCILCGVIHIYAATCERCMSAHNRIECQTNYKLLSANYAALRGQNSPERCTKDTNSARCSRDASSCNVCGKSICSRVFLNMYYTIEHMYSVRTVEVYISNVSPSRVCFCETERFRCTTQTLMKAIKGGQTGR